MVLFVHSDWLLSLGIVSAIYSPPGSVLDLMRKFSKKKGTIWSWLSTRLVCILKNLSTSVLLQSG